MQPIELRVGWLSYQEEWEVKLELQWEGRQGSRSVVVHMEVMDASKIQDQVEHKNREREE